VLGASEEAVAVGDCLMFGGWNGQAITCGAMLSLG
jgi:hypothetical protein